MTMLEAKHGAGADRDLFVLNLSPAVTEASLYTYLSETFGIRVKSIRVCRRHEDGSPLGHGYLNCFDGTQKENLKASFDGHSLDGQRVRVIDVIKDPKARKAGLKHANVFIQNLPIGIQVPQLEKCLSEVAGGIVSTKIPAQRPGKEYGVAYVQFGTQTAADTIIQQARQGAISIGNMCIAATPYMPYDERVQKKEEFTNLYVSGLPEDVLSDDDLRALFTPYGNVKSTRLGDLSRGFVNMETSRGAKAAIAGLNSKPMHVTRFLSKAERHKKTLPYYPPFPTHQPLQGNMNREGRNVYVKHLATDVDEPVLCAIFQNAGQVETVKVMRDQNGVSRGFGFVCFVWPQAALYAIGCMQGYELNGHRLYVSMSKPPKEAALYRRSGRSAQELMQAWHPVYEDPTMMEYPMPTNKAFLQVNPIHKTLSI